MTKFYFTLTTLCLLVIPVFGQTSLTPEKGYDVATWLPDYPTIGAFDFSDTLFYLNDGDTIYMVGITSGETLKKFGEPEDYSATHYVSFLTVSPDGNSIWTGYTSDGNLDDRIYSIDVERGEWELQATFPGNLDLEFWEDYILVSGLNSSSWDAPAAIFVLDTSGGDEHFRIIEPGGYSAGMAVDQEGNLYYGTSYASHPNALYRWNNTIVRNAIEQPGKLDLDTLHGEKLTDLPGGAYDCEVDEGGNVLFNMNRYGGTMATCMWNGIPGDGNNIDTLATASGDWDWLGILKSKGDITIAEPGNMIVTHSFGQPLAMLTSRNRVGVVRRLEPEISLFPNPSTGIFTISYDGAEQMLVEVYNLQGSLVYRRADLIPGAQIDMTHQPSGSYLMRITYGNIIAGKMVQKF